MTPDWLQPKGSCSSRLLDRAPLWPCCALPALLEKNNRIKHSGWKKKPFGIYVHLHSKSKEVFKALLCSMAALLQFLCLSVCHGVVHLLCFHNIPVDPNISAFTSLFMFSPLCPHTHRVSTLKQLPLISSMSSITVKETQGCALL